MEVEWGHGTGSGGKGEICGDEILVSLHNRLGPHCGEMRWLIYRYSHRKGPGTQASPILVSLRARHGNSYAKHGRWIARLLTLLRTLSLSLSLGLSLHTLEHRSWAGHSCHEVDPRRRGGHGAMATTHKSGYTKIQHRQIGHVPR